MTFVKSYIHRVVKIKYSNNRPFLLIVGSQDSHYLILHVLWPQVSVALGCGLCEVSASLRVYHSATPLNLSHPHSPNLRYVLGMWVMPRSQTQGPREIRITFILLDLSTSQGYPEASALLATSHSLLNKFLFFITCWRKRLLHLLAIAKALKQHCLNLTKKNK